MQKLDIRFLQNLKEKLAANNRRSIYLNALPNRYLTRLDLADLELLQQGATRGFLDILFSKATFSFPIALSNSNPQEKEWNIVRRLNAMTIENEDHYTEHGNKTFGLGFPILVFKDAKNPSKIIKAPLLIWSLDLERDFKQDNQWVIKREENFSVVTNPVLAGYLRQNNDLLLQPMYDQMLSDNILDKNELASVAHAYIKLFNPNISERTQELFRQVLNEEILSIKTDQEIENLPLDSPAILWSGVFGLFRNQKESIIKDLDYFINNIHQLQPLVEQEPNPSDPKKSSFMKHIFAMLETDPSQQQLLQELHKGKNLIVQGAPGTGKSQTLTGIIANAISNAGTCLVVCEKKTALDVIYNNLKKMGLQELAIMVEDVHRDRSALVESVLNRAQQQHQPYRVSPSFIRMLQNCLEQVNRLQTFNKKMSKPLSGNQTWTDIVGQFLDKNQNNEKEQLAKLLKNQQFDYNSAELEEILAILPEGEMLFQKLGTLQHPLNAINDRFFKQANATQVESDIKNALDTVCGVVHIAQRDAFTYLFEYEELLEKHFSEVYVNKMKFVEDILELIQQGLTESKYHFNKNTGLFRNLVKRFSNKAQKLEEEKVDILETFLHLQKYHAQYDYFKYQFMDTSDKSKLEFTKLMEHVNDYKTKVYEWHEGRGMFLQQLIKDLGPGKIYKYASFDRKVSEITRNLDIFEKSFTDSKVFKVDFQFASKTIRKRLTQIEELDQNLQKLKEEFDDFTNYHALKFFWLSLNSKQQAAVQALGQLKPKDWAGAFSAWYLNALLAHHEDQFVPDEKNYTTTRNVLLKELTALQELLIGHTLQYWRGKQTQAVQAFHQKKAPLTLHSLYNNRPHNGQVHSLRKIIETSPEILTSFFPVLLVSPNVCASILPLYPGMFDVVVFDEASQLNLEDTFGALVRGKYKIIAGDSLQLPPHDSFQSHYKNSTQDLVIDDEFWDSNDVVNSALNYLSNSDSLLDYALTAGSYQECFLKLHYRSQHPYLIDFSNAAFYGNRLVAFTAAQEESPIELKEVAGVYDNYTNQQEAQEIINYLLELVGQKTPCPSVAVVTFNLQQRNLILEQIHQKTVQDPAIGNKFQILFSNGLIIKNLENIQGEERDILLLSSTFGLQKDGFLPKDFGPIHHQDGYKLLNVIITRAKQKVVVFNSIPAMYYQNYESDILKNGNTGSGILYAYLAYAQAISNKDDKKRQAILDLLYQQCKKKPVSDFSYAAKRNFFEQHIFKFLKQFFPTLHIEINYPFTGIELPIAILNNEKQVVAAFYHDISYKETSENAYAWDLFHEEYLQKMGIACHRIWSKEWWENLNQAQQKLTELVKAVIMDNG